MRIRNQNKKLPTYTIVLMTAFAAVLIYGGLSWIYAWWPFNHSTPTRNTGFTDSTSGATQGEQQSQARTDAENKKDYINSQINNSDSPTTNASASNTSVSLSAYRQDTAVIVTTKLMHISDGVCELTVTNGSKQKSYIADVIYQPEYSMCAGFSIPISDLETGAWSFSLSVASNSVHYSADSSLDIK